MHDGIVDDRAAHPGEPGETDIALSREGRFAETDADGVTFEPCLEVVRRPLGDDAAPVDDRDAPGIAVRLLEIMGGEKNGDPVLLRQPRHLVPQRRAAFRVEPRRGLVEEEHPRPVNETHGEIEATPHAAGIGARQAPGGLLEIEQVEQGIGAGAQRLAAKAEQAPLKEQVLAARELLVDGRGLRHIADLAAHGGGLADRIMAGDGGPSGGGAGERRQHAHGRGLARAIGAEKGEDLPRLDGEGNAAHRLDRAGIGLFQCLDVDDGHDRRCLLAGRFSVMIMKWAHTGGRARHGPTAGGGQS